MTDARQTGWSSVFYCQALGMHLAFLQFAYFFLLEVYYSSRALTYFIVMFFWLIGFLVGLQFRWNRHFWLLLFMGTLAYYAALLANVTFPFRHGPLLLLAIMTPCSGLVPGVFFANVQRRFGDVRSVLIHENNGFILGTTLCLFTAVFHGRFLLHGGPLLGLILVFVTGIIAKWGDKNA